MEKISKNQIRKIGDLIRNDFDNISDSVLIDLQKYRTSFKETISDIFTVISKESKIIHSESISSYRIKRIDSIIRKLKRFKSIELDRMWDIAGCRFIFRNENQLFKLEKFIFENFFVIENQTRNYYKESSFSGYRSLHLYIRKNKDDLFTIEIQLRLTDDHNWATFVEITDLIYEDNAKEALNINDSKFGKFHLLLSKKNYKTADEKKEIINTVIQHKIYSHLSKMFISNYIEVRSQWECNSLNKKKKYFVIESQKDVPPLINSFESYEEAEEQYFIKFKDNPKANVLLTHLSNSSYEQISIAYSNYILTMHSFLDNFISLLQEMIFYSLKETDLKSFKIYYTEYLSTLFTHSKELNAEIEEIKRISDNKKKKRNYSIWKNDLDVRVKKLKTKLESFKKKISTVFPKSGINKFLFKWHVESINKKIFKL